MKENPDRENSTIDVLQGSKYASEVDHIKVDQYSIDMLNPLVHGIY